LTSSYFQKLSPHSRLESLSHIYWTKLRTNNLVTRGPGSVHYLCLAGDQSHNNYELSVTTVGFHHAVTTVGFHRAVTTVGFHRAQPRIRTSSRELEKMLWLPQQNLETVTEPFFESAGIDHEIEPLLTLTCAPHRTHKFFASSKSWSWLEDYFVHN